MFAANHKVAGLNSRSFLAQMTMAALLSLTASAAVAEEAVYSTQAPTVTLKAGAKGAATVTIKAAAGYHVNKDYPAKFTVEATAFAKSTKETLSAKEGDVKFTGNDAVVTVPLQALAAGAGPLTLTGNFSVCSAEQCYLKRGEKLIVQIAVK